MKQKNFLRLMALLLSLAVFAGCALQKVSSGTTVAGTGTSSR